MNILNIFITFHVQVQFPALLQCHDITLIVHEFDTGIVESQQRNIEKLLNFRTSSANWLFGVTRDPFPGGLIGRCAD